MKYKLVAAVCAACILVLIPTNVTIAQDIKLIGEMEHISKIYDTEVVTYSDTNGLVYSDSAMTKIYGYEGTEVNLVIPGTVTEVQEYAFWGH